VRFFLAVSKLAAGRPKDIDFVRVLLREQLVAAEVLHERVDAVSKLDETRKNIVHDLVTRLAA